MTGRKEMLAGVAWDAAGGPALGQTHLQVTTRYTKSHFVFSDQHITSVVRPLEPNRNTV